jgi:hypothetical protein
MFSSQKTLDKQTKTFNIVPSTDLHEVGVSMQIQEFSRTLHAGQSLYHYQNALGWYDDVTEFPVYRMESSAVLTDLVSNVPLGIPLMISKRCLRLFQSVKLPDYQVFPLKFFYKGNLNQDYVAFSIVKHSAYLDYISWENSVFFKTSNFHCIKISEHNFNSMDELLKNKNEFESAGFGLMAEIRIRYNNDYDIINFGRYPLNLGYLCSENTKHQIISSGLTGFEFREISSELFVEE